MAVVGEQSPSDCIVFSADGQMAACSRTLDTKLLNFFYLFFQLVVRNHFQCEGTGRCFYLINICKELIDHLSIYQFLIMKGNLEHQMGS